LGRETTVENTSGQGIAAVVPPEIDRWNWGAMLLNWIWGIGNNTFIALLMFVPLVNFVMPFVLGAKGSAWAWRNKRWESVEHFRRVQRIWAIAGAVTLVALIGFGVAIWFSVMALFKNSEAYQMAVAQLNANTEVVGALGTPISTGFPSGSIQTSGPTGSALLQFSVEGPKGRGTVYLQARKDLGTWRIIRMEVQVEGRPARIILGEGNRVRLEEGWTVAAVRSAADCSRLSSCPSWAHGLH
jgi:hypothetical protein